MSTRISRAVLEASPLEGRRWGGAVLLLLTLSACGQTIPTKADNVQATAKVRAHAEAESRIPCALDGARDFTPVCAIDSNRTQDGLILTVRHPDGAFRRLKVMTDGSGVIAADGAEEARVTVLAPDRIVVAIAGARYQLPATVRPAAK